MNRVRQFCGWVAGALLAGLVSAAQAQSKMAAAPIFDRPTLLHLAITVATQDAASLRREPRQPVPATIRAGSNEFVEVALHLKGGQGSVRPLDEKPAFTLNFAKSQKDQRFFGLHKIHLNNSVQDPTYLCEDLAGELFRRAGVPAPRTAWATVEFNGRKLGLFVLKEGFTRDFLRQHFADANGNLYDGGTHREITQPLELASGSGPRHHEDLQALARAAEESANVRWKKLKQVLDVERFTSFLAMEVLAGHIDGYSAMQNNYRIYFDPASGRAVFLPHGMDRMFYEPAATLEPYTKGLVASACVSTPEGKALYQRRAAELAERVFQPEWMTNRINERVQLLEPVEPLVAREAQPLKERIVARAAFARRTIGKVPSK
jgi:spore coat protein H